MGTRTRDETNRLQLRQPKYDSSAILPWRSPLLLPSALRLVLFGLCIRAPVTSSFSPLPPSHQLLRQLSSHDRIRTSFDGKVSDISRWSTYSVEDSLEDDTHRTSRTALFASIAHPASYSPSSRNPRKKPSKRTQIRDLFRKAKAAERQGQWRVAVRLLTSILTLDPTDAHSHLALARLEARRNTGHAAQTFRTGTTHCPNSVHLWQAWAVYEDSRQNSTVAAQFYQRALDLDPYNPYACHAYGLMVYKKQGAVEEARALWERALERTSTAALVCSLGELWIAKGEYGQARELYEENVKRLDHDGREQTEVYLALAWLEERYFSNFDVAEKLLEHSLELSPQSSVAQIALARLQGRRQQRHQENVLSGTKNGGNKMRLSGRNVQDATIRRLASACLVGESGNSTASQPVDGRVYNAWAHMETKRKRFSEARKILRRGLERYPQDHTLLQAAGTVEERLHNYTGARELYSASLAIQPSAPTLVGYALLDMRHPERGVPVPFNDTKRLFEEALLLDKRHGPAYNAYARAVLKRQSDPDQARRIYERGVRRNCTDVASIYHGYARLELSLGNVDTARDLLVKGLQQVRLRNVGMDCPHRERAVYITHTLGMMELQSNRPSASLEVFTDGIERFGNSSQLLLGAALAHDKLGNEKHARTLFEQSVIYDEKHAHAWQAWGVMEMRAGNLKAAKTLFECGIKSAPRHGALWQAYGIMESRLGNLENARSIFEKGIKMSSNQVSLYQSWASLELREGYYSAAKTLITQALTRDKGNGSGWLIASEIENHLGRSGLACLLLRRGIECARPSNTAQLYRALGDALVRQGKINEAREIFERGMQVDPTHAQLYHSLAELEARVFNLDGLARLNKRAASIFSTNALEPSPKSSAAWGSKIRAGRSRDIASGVAALAQRIGEGDGKGESNEYSADETISQVKFQEDDDQEPSEFLNEMMSSSRTLEESLVNDLLLNDEKNATDISGDSL